MEIIRSTRKPSTEVNDTLIGLKDIAKELNVSVVTIRRWITFYFSDLDKPEELYLPMYRRIGKSKLYKSSDVDYFKEFAINLKRGNTAVLSRYISKGKQALNEEELEKLENSISNQKRLEMGG